MSRISKLYHTAEGKAAALMAKPLENSSNPKHWKATEIQPNLWLGDVRSAHLHKLLKEKGVTHIVQILNHVEPPFPEEFKYKVVNVNDCPEEDLFDHFDPVLKFMRDAMVSGGGVYVHCMKGKSRSAAMMGAYLMAENGWTKDQALAHIKTKRSKIDIIPSWEAALDKYQSELERRKQSRATVGSPSSRVLHDHGSSIMPPAQSSPAMLRREKHNSGVQGSPVMSRKGKEKSTAMSPDTGRQSWRKAEQPGSMSPILVQSPHMSRVNRSVGRLNTASSPEPARIREGSNASPDISRRSNWTKAKSPESVRLDASGRQSWRKAEQPGSPSPTTLIQSPHITRLAHKKTNSGSWRKAEQPGSSSNLVKEQEGQQQEPASAASLIQSPHITRLAHKKTNSSGVSPVGSPSMSRIRRV